MKNSKIVALVATAALLVLGMAFTSFAAAKYNWYQVDGIWHCKDKNGDDITQDWAKSGSDMYYLDENGEMVTETLIDVDDNYYYVDADGKMVKNDWKKIENTSDDDGDDAYWYYFQNSGKAKKDTATPVSINGKKYMFNDEARMQYGWIGGTTDDDYAWQDAVYYAGDADDGAIKTGWVKLDVIDNDDTLDFEEQTYWFWFQSSGKKFAAPDAAVLVEKSINGKKYAFDEHGVMKAEWEPTAATATEEASKIGSYAWFQDAEVGAKLKKGWFRVVPKDAVHATDNEEETSHWYYAKGDGTLYKQVVKTINGKKYAFDEKGEMLAGLFVMDINDGSLDHWEPIDSEAAVSALTAAGAGEKQVYFFGDEETDGAMKYGTVTTEIDGDDYTFLFDSTGSKKGQAHNGLKGNYWYVNGAKLKADGDMKYEMFEARFTGTGSARKVESVGEKTTMTGTDLPVDPTSDPTVLISSTGAIVKNGTKKNADDVKIKVETYAVTKYNVQ